MNRRNVMKNRLIILLIPFTLFAAFSFTGCGEQKQELTKSAEVTVPPLLKEENNNNITKSVELSDAQANELNIKTLVVKADKHNFVVSAPGFVVPAPKMLSVVSAPVDGRVVSIYAHEGEHVSKGEVLLELESLEFGSLVADYLQTKAEESYNKNRFERIKLLVEKNISSQSELDKAEADYLRSSTRAKASYAKLLTVGVLKSDLENFENSEAINPRLRIISPINGIIDQHLIDLGQSVKAYDKLLSVIDNKEVLIHGYVAPEDGANLKPGDRVLIYRKDMQNKNLEAEITTINPALDNENKSLVVNIITKTKNGWPKPGENVRLDILSEIDQPIISIPTSAVVYEGNKAVVFVRKGKNIYEVRHIKVSRINGDNILVESGLNDNDEIAVSQLFSLKALNRYEQFAEE